MAKGPHGNDDVWQKLLAKVGDLSKVHARVGVFGDAGSEVVEIAAVHEFGSKDGRLPERSFIRRTFIEKEGELEKLTVRLARGIINGNIEVDDALNILGDWGKTAVKQFIASNSVLPATKAATNAAKNARAGQKSSAKTTTLIDTGRMYNSITYDVVTDGDTGPQASDIRAFDPASVEGDD